MDEFIGRTIGQYVIETSLARGGQGSVYRARHRFLGQYRAVKVLLPDHAAESNFVERFLREAKVAAGLDHPNIVRIFDFGEQDSIFYLVMELVEGQSLREQVAPSRPLPSDRAVRLLAQLASALDHVHEHGFVHRDLKPSNLMIRPNGQLVLVDFGIAYDRSTTRLTQVGTVIGTPDYLAPEVILGQEIGPAADRYALGIITYEMLTGRPPFAHTRPHEILLAQINEIPPPIRQSRPDLAAAVDGVMDRILAKDPDRRYQTAVEFVAALRGAIGAGQPAERVDRTLRRTPRDDAPPKPASSPPQASIETRLYPPGTPGFAAAEPTWSVFAEQLRRPAGVAVDWQGSVFVADSGNDRILKLDRQGQVLERWGTTGILPGQFRSPEGLTTDGWGHIYVADTKNGRIQKLSSTGNVLAIWTSTDRVALEAPQAVAIDESGRLFIVDWARHQVVIFGPAGELLDAWPTDRYPSGIAVDRRGNVFVANWSTDQIVRYTIDGMRLDTIGTKGTTPGQLWNPCALTFDGPGDLLVADMNNHRIQRLSLDGTPRTASGTFGKDVGQFRYPVGIASDGGATIYVADTGNHRIQRLS